MQPHLASPIGLLVVLHTFKMYCILDLYYHWEDREKQGKLPAITRMCISDFSSALLSIKRGPQTFADTEISLLDF